MEVEFVDELPEASRHYGVIKQFAEKLKENPGRWAKYPTEVKHPYQLTWNINHDGMCSRALHGPEFQAMSRGGRVYVMYAPVVLE